MDKIAKLSAAQRRELFSETAARMNLLPGLIEKDFWVCWTLKHLFSIPEFESHLLFKGGTTLSKIFGVIQRFSEDIDLAVDWEMLGFRGDRSPHSVMSKTKQTKLLKEMLQACEEYISSDFLGILRKRISELLTGDLQWKVEVDQDDPNIVNFFYPATAETVTYVRPAVRLELGTHAEFIPNEEYTIRPYAADHFPDLFENAGCELQAIKIERTFWEKATILHQEHHRDADRPSPPRMSRHYYDVFMMGKRDDIRTAALGDPTLLTRVVEHKKKFFPRAWARYDLAVPASLQIQPSPVWVDYLHQDYQKMKVMFFGDEPPFDEILDGLERLESAIRKMK
jgi:hypothetical protein